MLMKQIVNNGISKDSPIWQFDLKQGIVLRVRSSIGLGKVQILVINRVRVSESRLHTPTQIFGSSGIFHSLKEPPIPFPLSLGP